MSWFGSASEQPPDSGDESSLTYEEVEKFVSGLTGASLVATFAFRRALDGSFSFPFVSPVVEETFRISREELARDASPLLSAINPSDRNRVLYSIAESATNLAEWTCEFKIDTPARGPMRLEGRAVPRRKKDGTIIWHGYLRGDRTQADGASGPGEGAEISSLY